MPFVHNNIIAAIIFDVLAEFYFKNINLAFVHFVVIIGNYINARNTK
jgi:hypothetical protein